MDAGCVKRVNRIDDADAVAIVFGIFFVSFVVAIGSLRTGFIYGCLGLVFEFVVGCFVLAVDLVCQRRQSQVVGIVLGNARLLGVIGFTAAAARSVFAPRDRWLCE